MGPNTRHLAKPANSRPRRLTPTRIAGLASAEAPYDVPDPDMPGLQLHIGSRLSDGSAGAKSWQFRFRWRGGRPKVTLGTYPEMSQHAAHDAVRKAREQIVKGIDPRRALLGRRAPKPASPGAPAPHSIEHLADEYFTRHIRPRLKRPEQVERLINVEVIDKWRGRDARAITPRDVVELLDAIVDRGSPSTANDLAAYLGQMYRFGIQRGLVESSPVMLLYRPGGPERPRSRALSDAELTTLLHRMDDIFKRAPDTATVIRVLLYTACRRGELAGARWSELALDGEAVWTIPPERTKTGEQTGTPYVVPLVAAAVAEFRTLKRMAGRSSFVLPAESGDGPMDPKLLTRSLARHLATLKKNGIEPFTLHDLRRTVRTGLARLKVPPHIAERCLNHSQPGIAAVYDVYAYVDEKRDALAKWAAHLATLGGAA